MMQRRSFLATGLVGFTLSALHPGIAMAAADTDKRFIFLIQRGAADGLAILAPTGDPSFLPARGGQVQKALKGTKLDSFFTLHPQLSQTADLFKQGEAGFAHAVASGYRRRSHFDGQNILESGGIEPYARKDGWMNRLLTLLPEGGRRALAVAPSVPLALSGKMPASSYEKSAFDSGSDDLHERVAMLYANDPELTSLWQDALKADAMAGVTIGKKRGGAALGQMASGLMRGANGAKIMMLESDGWDTHSRQDGRLNSKLKQLDAFVAALKEGLGDDWKNTLLIVATEFGRTVAFNGTAGTDHGTGSAMLMFGGNLASGGKILSDWPGLKPSSLFEGRDLRPTLRFENLVSEALSAHYRISKSRMRQTLFPDYS